MLRKIFGLVSGGARGKAPKRASMTAVRRTKRKVARKAGGCEFC